ncbi:cilia- and flagella-associated protein 70 [Periophthalmus magnuspinnatus]|uniref:cilia- and flagella-associated protein 70 n=1 Tax=Periophthalmus magnuspinnatus TaxID=409849 RepID=UPI002436A491|nr:cilia- and flagella-associated protein 70 [Periophthalmus magnuspinnatus]
MDVPQTPAKVLPHTVTVTVERGNRLQGRKAEFQSFVKVEVDGTVLGESEKRVRHLSETCFNYEFSCSFQCARDPQAIAELARKLGIVTVLDFLPEEKKADTRTVVLGQAVLDFLPLLHGQTSFSSRVPLYSAAAIQTKTQDNNNKPTVDVVVHVSEALVSADALSFCNLLRVTVETAFSVPESWTLPSGSSPTASSYTAALEVPLTAEKNQMLVFCDGTLKAGGVREERGRQKKRPFLPQLLPANTVVPGAFMELESVENENGELMGKEDLSFRKEAETKKNRVSWDVEMCCFLNREATNRLRETITKCKLWPLEIMRSMQPLEETSEIPFHGVAFVDMTHLLFPGATRIRGAYCIQPFSESLLSHKAKRSVSVLKEYTKDVAVAARCSSAADKKAAGKGSAKKPVVKMNRTDAVTEIMSEMEQAVNTQGNLYVEARTYIMIEISLEKPLIPKTPPEELSRRVMALIPPKPPLPKGPTKAQRAVQSYHEQVANVVSQVCEQVEELYCCDCSLTEINREHMKAEVMGELNMSGRYFAFKEQLKHAVVRIVRDKMQRTESITNPRQRQEFVSKLYVYLVDEMHVALNKIYSDEIHDETEGFHLSQAQLRHFAKEAQSIGDYEQSLEYYQELLVRNPSDPLNKFDLGSHYMLTGDYMKAKEYYHDAVATDQAHQPSLIMCGVLAIMSEQYTEAQTFLEHAATLESYGVEAWTLLGLLHQSQEDEVLCERAFLEANKLLKAKGAPRLKNVLKVWSELMERSAEEKEKLGTRATPPTPQEEHQQESENADSKHEEKKHEAEEQRILNRASIYAETVSFLLQNSALQMAERALAQELLSSDGGQSVFYLLHLARLHLLRKNYSSALANLEVVLDHNDENAEAWALKGHCLFLQGSLNSAQESYECSLSFHPPPENPHLVLLRLGDICQQEGQFEQAKLVHLQACEQSPSCLTWLGLGAACYRLGELSLAETALTEANHLNNRNAQVWAYLSFICLKSGRLKEAEQFYKYAVQFKLQNEDLIREYTQMFDQARFSYLDHCFEGAAS